MIKKIVLISIALCLFGCTKPKNSCTVTLHAAAGTRMATEAIVKKYEKATRCSVRRNYASSGTLARQIASGAPGDLYISANKQWIEYLNSKKILKKESIKSIGGNRLVIIAPKDSTLSDIDLTQKTPDLKGDDKIVIGDPAYVPVGKYAAQVFKKINWFDQLKGKMIMTKDVSSVRHYIGLKSGRWGVVYQTETINATKIKIIKEIPENLHKPIRFFIAQIKDGKPEGQKLLEQFTNQTGQAILKQFGFSPKGE